MKLCWALGRAVLVSVARLQVTLMRGWVQMCCGIDFLGFCVGTGHLFGYKRVFVTTRGCLFLLGLIYLDTWRALYLC